MRMLDSFPTTLGRQRHARFGVAVVFLLVFVASAAQATPVNLFGDPVTGFGFRAADVAAASGVGSLPDQATFLTNANSNISVLTPPTITGTNNPAGDFSNPSTGSSVWTVTANDRAYTDLWIVLIGHSAGTDPHGPNGDGFYAQPNVGLAIDDADPNLAFVRAAGFTSTYLAIFLGDLAQGQSTGVPINYAVAQALLDTAPPGSSINDYLFPQYQAAFVEVARVPEPGIAALVIVAAGFGLGVRARRNRETI